MICKICIRSVIAQAGHTVTFTKTRVHLNNFERVRKCANPWNRAFRTNLRMMVDTGEMEKQGSILDVLPDKDEDGEYTSGSWKSEGRKLSCGYSSFRGKRATMEDFYDIKMSKIDGQTVCLFGIFDGHGGSRAAEYLKEHLFENLMKHPRFITDTKLAISASKFFDASNLCITYNEALGLYDCSISPVRMQDPIRVWDPAWNTFSPRDLSLFGCLVLLGNLGELAGESYQQTDADFLASERDTYRDDGSTASTAVLVGNHLYVANVGDSRTIISKAGRAIPLSEDHKPNRSDERKRIESAGGVVMWAGTWRVGGVLAMSRAFGNRMLKQFVVAEPEIQDQEVDEEFEFIVLASDGLWDVVPNEVAVEVAQTEEQPEAAARKLTAVAFCRGSADNITCIVVKFHHHKAEPASEHRD